MQYKEMTDASEPYKENYLRGMERLIDRMEREAMDRRRPFGTDRL